MTNKFFYKAFEDHFRGSRELILERLNVYIPFIKMIQDIYPNANALDLGCGRGEWLQLLQENGIIALGVDTDTAMLENAKEYGLSVILIDALSYLKSLPDSSINIVSGFHIAEHLPFEVLHGLIQESLRVLTPAGLLILETPNPENLRVGTENFYLDQTHIRPIPSQLMSFLVEYYGFTRTSIVKLQESKDLLKSEYVTLSNVINSVSPDYAIITQKIASISILEKFDELFAKNYGQSLDGLLDRFEKRLFSLEQRANEANERASHAEKSANEANERASHAEKSANEALHNYQIVVNSNLWKMTNFLSLMGKFVMWFVRGSYHWVSFSPASRPRRVLKKKLIAFNNYMNARPSLKYRIIKILNLCPGLKKKLKILVFASSKIVICQHDRDELSFEAQKIFDRLIQIRDNDTNKSLLNQNEQIDTTVLKPKMAIVTPFPPDHTGIADYVAELLPDLCENYQVDIIVKQDSKYFSSFGSFQTIEYFKVNYNLYNIVIYQMGNSPYHAHMFELIQDFPGIVVLHDFYLGNLIHWLNWNYLGMDNIWDAMLIDKYGYMAPYLEKQKGIEWAINKFPLNNLLFEMAKGIIVHSSYAKNLSLKWYGDKFNHKIYILPQVHRIIDEYNCVYRNNENFLVCSFGHIIQSKLIHRIISAWQSSEIGQNSNNQLLFVGTISNDEYGQKIKTMIQTVPNITITGFVEDEEYQRILSKTNIAIQLRSESRGETSRAVLDCMAYGIPTIVNANGSMQELPDHAVLKIQDTFDNQELIDAMNALYKNTSYTKKLSTNAQEVISREHSPQIVVKKIQEIIQEVSILSKQELSLEQFYSRSISNGIIPNNDDLSNLAKQFELDTRYNKTPSIYVDISAVAIHDLKTGIQRVVRSILLALLKISIAQYKIIPVYLTDKGGYWHYRVAHNFMYSLIPNLIHRADTVIEPSAQDIFLGLDYYANAVTESIKHKLFKVWKQRGVNINFVVYDILPIMLPHYFPATSYYEHEKWLNAIVQVTDSLLCISNTVANEVKKYIDTLGNDLCNVPNIKYFHLGADLDNSLPSKGLPENAGAILQHITSRITFLMVGTVEPRKGHSQTLMAFEELWDKKIDINLIIVGKEGWNVDILSEKLHHHKQLNHHLFWLEGISDEYLDQIYQASTCLIAASEGEGFGLPLIEAAQHKIPIIARDILVFREVASNYAYYFDNDNAPIVLAKAIEEWLTLYQSKKHPKSDEMPWLTWDESANSLMKNILGEN